MDLGERIRTRRNALGLSQEAVAREAGISLRAFTELERGVATNPHVRTLSGLAAALDTTIAALVGEEPEGPKVEAPSSSQPSLVNALAEEERRKQIKRQQAEWRHRQLLRALKEIAEHPERYSAAAAARAVEALEEAEEERRRGETA